MCGSRACQFRGSIGYPSPLLITCAGRLSCWTTEFIRKATDAENTSDL